MGGGEGLHYFKLLFATGTKMCFGPIGLYELSGARKLWQRSGGFYCESQSQRLSILSLTSLFYSKVFTVQWHDWYFIWDGGCIQTDQT